MSNVENWRKQKERYGLKLDLRGHPAWQESIRARKESKMLEQIGWGQVVPPHAFLSGIINNEAQKV